MTVRNEWRFQFSASVISKAAKDEAAYHEERLDWWKIEQERATEQAKAASVVVRKHEVTGGKRVEVVLDPSVSKRLQECESKISAHRAAFDDFKRWADAMSAMQPRQNYDLDPDDVAYFRLAGGARPE